MTDPRRLARLARELSYRGPGAAERLAENIRGLPLEQQAALDLFYGLSLGSHPLAAEDAAARLGITVGALRHVLRLARARLALYRDPKSNRTASLLAIADATGYGKDELELLAANIERLPGRFREVFVARHGLRPESQGQQTLQATGEQFDIGRERTNQIIDRCLNDLVWMRINPAWEPVIGGGTRICVPLDPKKKGQNPIEALCLLPRTHAALSRAGISTVDDLRAHLRLRTPIYGIGKLGKDDVEDRLAWFDREVKR